MRTVRFSLTFNDQLNELLDYGEAVFGSIVTEAKKRAVYDTVEHVLARFPGAKRGDPNLGLTVYPITATPFVVLYDFDENELRIHFIFHRRASLKDIDPGSAEW